MRAGHHDPLRADLAQGLHVLRGEHLVEDLVAGAPGRVAGAGLGVAEDREAHPRGVQQLGHRPRRLLGPVLVGAGATHPEQVVDVRGALDVVADDRHLEVQVLGPVHALARRQPPRVPLGLHLAEHAAELLGEGRLHEHLLAAHVDDVVDVLDVHRALVHAGPAGGAGPQDVGGDDLPGQGRRPRGHTRLGGGRLGRQQRAEYVAGVGGPRLQAQVRLARQTVVHAQRLTDQPTGGGAGGHHLLGDVVGLDPQGARGPQVGGGRRVVVAQRHDEQLGGQGLAGVPRRAQVLAAATLGAGGEVQQALPGEVLDAAHAQAHLGALAGVGGLHGLLQRVHGGLGQGLVADHERLERAQGLGAVHLAARVDVEDRQEPVPGHAHRGLQAHDDEPGHRQHHLDGGDDEDRVAQGAGAHRGEQRAGPGRQREVRPGGQGPLRRVGGGGQVGVLQHPQRQHAGDHADDGGLDELRLGRRRAGEARGAWTLTAVGVRGVGRGGPAGPGQAPAQDRQTHDPEGGQPADEFDDPGPPGGVADERQREVGPAKHLPVAGHEGEEQQREGDHDQPVGGLDEGAALEGGVAHERPQRERQALADRAKALRCGCAAHGHAGANSETGACENCDTDRRGDDDDDDTDDLHGTHRGGFPQVSEGKGGSAGRWPEAPRKVACAAHRWRSPPAYPGGDWELEGARSECRGTTVEKVSRLATFRGAAGGRELVWNSGD